MIPQDFILRALLAGLAVALVAAPLGCFVVWRRMAYFGSTIAHSGLLGVALGFLLAIDLTIGVLAVSIVISLMLAGLQRQRLLPTDTLLGILAHVALAGGLIAAGMLGGSRLDLMGYLFGDILAVGTADLAWMIGGGTVVLIAMLLLWRPLLAMSVHEELAAAEGVNVRVTGFAFMLLLALAVALAMKVVGILLITALLVIPAATARPFATTPEGMALLSAMVAGLAVMLGLWFAFAADLAAGPAIVMALATLFTLSLVRLFAPASS